MRSCLYINRTPLYTEMGLKIAHDEYHYVGKTINGHVYFLYKLLFIFSMLTIIH